MSGARWNRVLDSALNRHNENLQRLQARLKFAEQSLESTRIKIAAIATEMAAEIARSGQEIRTVISWRNDPVVYVRNYNETTLEVYHGWLDCGWANSTRVRTMLLGEAKAAGLRPCISCGHLAGRQPQQDVAA